MFFWKLMIWYIYFYSSICGFMSCLHKDFWIVSNLCTCIIHLLFQMTLCPHFSKKRKKFPLDFFWQKGSLHPKGPNHFHSRYILNSSACPHCLRNNHLHQNYIQRCYLCHHNTHLQTLKDFHRLKSKQFEWTNNCSSFKFQDEPKIQLQSSKM